MALRGLHWVEDVLGEELQARLAQAGGTGNEVGFDPFGFDPQVGRYALAAAALLYRVYFRTQAFGLEQLPPGRTLIVANHSGQLPLDGMMIGTALLLDADPPRLPRSMVERWSAKLPFVSTFLPRAGQVVGSPDNARRLLEREETLVVFPEGAAGIAKPFEKRYQLESFGPGFVRLALETGTPIVPTAVIGAEEQYISVANLRPLARLLGMPSFPVVPQCLVTGLLPLPTRYRLHFGTPLRLEGDPDDDDAAIAAQVWQVRAAVQSLVHHGLRQRRHVFY